jgi:hypothetical protein
MVAVLAHDIEIAPSENLTAGEPNLDWFCGQVGRSQTEEFELVFVSEGPRMRAGDPGLHLGKNLLDGIPFERLELAQSIAPGEQACISFRKPSDGSL